MYLLGFDIGGTKCSAIAGKSGNMGDLEIIGKKSVATSSCPNPYSMIRTLGDMAQGLLDASNLSSSEITSIGISCGGPLDSVSGMVYSPPNLQGWDSVPVSALFSERFGRPAYLQNDANACALAEWLLGAGKGYSNLIFLTFGTGMGAGLILNGKLYCGKNDLAGEVGHIRLANTGPVGYGKAGSFECFCRGGGIARMAAELIEARKNEGGVTGLLSGRDEPDAKAIFEAAGEGDIMALEIVAVTAEYLGRGLALLIDILNPECIIIGSIYSRNEALFKTLVENVLERETLPQSLKACKVVPAVLGESTGDFAALCVALYNDKF